MEPFTRSQAWIDLILLANHKPGVIRVRGNRVDVKRGQVGWSQVALAKRWKWSRGKVRRFLKELEKNDHQIVQQKNNITTLINIINYEQYQGNGTADGTADGQQTDSRRYTNKNDKNDKKGKNTLVKRILF
jgi:DNA replication protein DnaD